VTDTARWDAQTLNAQERTVGRWKVSGATLDHPDLPDDRTNMRLEPNFAADPTGATTPLTAHIRKANPRSAPEDPQRRIFRRGYPLVQTGPDGRLERGLVFVAFARSTSTQFEFIMRAWMRNRDFPAAGAGVDALLAFDEKVLAGGYFFVPALTRRNQPTSWALPFTLDGVS
jgi:Dyp-type peroxidase family